MPGEGEALGDEPAGGVAEREAAVVGGAAEEIGGVRVRPDERARDGVEAILVGECADAGMGDYCTALGCAQCTTDSQCTALDAGTPYCFNICVQCVTAADCPSTNRGCNGATATCGSCIFNGDCPSTYGCLLQGTSGGVCAPICTSVDAGACAACESSGDCSGGKQCNLTTGICS